MTLLEKINNLTWWNEPNKLKDIFKQLLKSYKVYTASVSQFGTGIPSVIVLENSVGDITLSYTSVGNYSLNSNSLFILGKTTVSLSQTDNSNVNFKYTYVSPSKININTKDKATSVDTNGLLVSALLEIKVYL